MLKQITYKDIFIVILILVLTFGYFLDEQIFFKNNTDDVNYYSVEGLFYYSKMKFLIIGFTVIWYFTNNHWWRSSILVVLTIELMKLISVFNTQKTNLDEIEFALSLPITIPIIALIVFVSNKINDYYLLNNLRSVLDDEIDTIFFELFKNKKEEINKLEEKITALRKSNNTNEKSLKYLKELIKLRDEFYDI